MNILGIKNAKYIDATNTLIDLVLETDDGDLPFTYSPKDTAPASDFVRSKLSNLSITPYIAPPLPTLDEMKAEKLAYIANARWQEEVAPYFYPPKNAYFDTSERSQIKYLQALQKGISTMWKTVDGWVEMTQADFAGLIASYEAFVSGLFAKEEMLSAVVQAAETPEKLEAITW